MTHPDADALLRFVLQTSEDSERSAVAEHIVRCEACARAEREIRADVLKLETAGDDIRIPAPPALPRRLHRTLAFSRWAAVLAAGFLLGYVTSNLTSALPAIPVQQRLIPERVTEDTLGFMPCQPVDAGAPAAPR